MITGRARTECSLCRGDQLDTCAKLPHTPIANEFAPASDRDQPSDLFPLELLMCRACHHVQISWLVDPARLFSEYLYETSTSPQTITHLREEALALVSAVAARKWKEKPRFLEIGSNDGAFLKELVALGVDHSQVLGVEPSKTMSAKATRDGVPTICAFFDRNVGKLVRKGYAAITANNVLAHVPSVRDVLEVIAEYLAPEGILVMEVGSAADIFGGAFDVIYHEHTSYHALLPLRRALEEVDTPMYDVERFGGEVGRGSIRIWAGRGRNPSARMMSELVREEMLHLDDLGAWMRTLGKGRRSVVTAADNKISSFFSRMRPGNKVLGYGAPAKMTTLTYACQVPRVAAIIDDSPWKIGRLTPGQKISVVDIDAGLAMKPDAIFAFAWNFADVIADKLRKKGWSGELFVPLPEGRVIEIRRRG